MKLFRAYCVDIDGNYDCHCDWYFNKKQAKDEAKGHGLIVKGVETLTIKKENVYPSLRNVLNNQPLIGEKIREQS